ncbi:phosphatidate phosphatase LPIN3 [Gracilinanus agilis]|uniref:phosphatidate phosphatase LPIN3 n=1 Tax=Gracilinanus agilis TaxID=191870 RepID=UPI001CFE9410|nr:phosphatidate phosphatase LPIN3 [Gracilinanus agilis]
MNYVGQLAETVYEAVKELYQGLNPATLSGGVDVLVVKHPDGSFLCSPFHVRFGKLDVLRTKEQVVDIEINGKPVDLQMKLGVDGEAFFVQEPESSEEDLPFSRCCSSFPLDTSNEMLTDFIVDARRKSARPRSISRKKRLRKKAKKKDEKLPGSIISADTSSEELEDAYETLLEDKASSLYSFSSSSEYLTSFKSDSEVERDSDCKRSKCHKSSCCCRKPRVKKFESSDRMREESFDTTVPYFWEESNEDLPSSQKRSYHMGPNDIYLEDLPSLNSSSAALYFPPSCSRCDDRFWDASTHPEIIQPKIQVPEEQKNNITLSLCGGLNENQGISTEKFSKHIISYQDLANDPGILQDPRLVVKIEDKHYNWAVAAPMILSLQAFQKTLPKSTVDMLVKEKMSKKSSSSWWFSWRRKDWIPEDEIQEDISPSSLQSYITSRWKLHPFTIEDPLDPVVNFDAPSGKPPVRIPNFKKTLRLSSDQIRNLNLKEGSNEVVFSVTTQYQGTCRCQATIYLWNWSDKVVVSDIDGTITKSDALGHILPQLGKDWTHHGIIKLYHKIHLNGYKFLYCSARAIGMADITKRYLKWVNDQGCVLPRGPLLLTPSSLFSALHREVVEKKPEVFKTACLKDILHLFKPGGDPFYAGFGNRNSDVRAYLHVGIPKCRIFTVNPQGQLIQELIKNHKTTFDHLLETVEHMFPPINAGPTVKLIHPEFSGFCYWRKPLAAIDLSEIH